MTTPSPDAPKVTLPIPDHYTIGDNLKWDAPWIRVHLWVELPFWLMVKNMTVSVVCEGHEFPIEIHDDYFQLFFGEATDSRSTVGYHGPLKKREDLPPAVREAMDQRPAGPYMWRKCKTYLRVESRCNEDVWNAAGSKEIPRANEVRLYLSDLCRAHLPVVNKLIQAYRLATYDYFPYEVAPWDVPTWTVEREGRSIASALAPYRVWDGKPRGFDLPFDEIVEKISKGEKLDPPTLPYELIREGDLRAKISAAASPGEFELLDALNLMERGDYSGAVRRVTTAIEVVVEAVVGKSVEEKEGGRSAVRFLRETETNFPRRVSRYEGLSGRSLPDALRKELQVTRKLRHRIVHRGYRIGPGERGRAQRAVDTGRWTFNWFENDDARRDVREKRIAFRSLGRDLTAGVFRPRITPDGVVLSPIGALEGFGGAPKGGQ
jgi:hypothetical protein